IVIARRCEKVRGRAVAALPVWRTGVDPARIRAAPVCFSRSDTSAESAFGRPGKRVASATSCVAPGSPESSGSAALWIGDFGHSVRIDLRRFPEPAFSDGRDDRYLERVPVLRSSSLPGALQSVAVRVDCPSASLPLLPSLHEQQTMFRGN